MMSRPTASVGNGSVSAAAGRPATAPSRASTPNTHRICVQRRLPRARSWPSARKPRFVEANTGFTACMPLQGQPGCFPGCRGCLCPAALHLPTHSKKHAPKLSETYACSGLVASCGSPEGVAYYGYFRLVSVTPWAGLHSPMIISLFSMSHRISAALSISSEKTRKGNPAGGAPFHRSA